ncbi:MAG TPA: hypothetical protein VNO70_05360 [Blastocatellia bacterium]|nr:hypothetical protein [Blastocatellia bacterium]
MKVNSLILICWLISAPALTSPGFAAAVTGHLYFKGHRVTGSEKSAPSTGSYYHDDIYGNDFSAAYDGRAKVTDDASEQPPQAIAGWSDADADVAAPPVIPAPPVTVAPATALAFSLSKINASVVKEFRKAWSLTASGRRDVEAVVLLFRKLDGSYVAESQGSTNERKKFTFRWVANAIAIVHTHPNSDSPKPSDQDKRIADKYGVPMFTITVDGMYMYDPQTKQTTKVKDGLDWRDPAKWLP